MLSSGEGKPFDIFRISISDLFQTVEYLLTTYTDTSKYANRFYRNALVISNTDFDLLEKWKCREDSKIEPHKVESFYRNLILIVERFATDGIDDIEEDDPIVMIFKGLIYLSILSRYYDFGITCMRVISYHYKSSNYRHREFAKIAMRNTFPSIFKRFVFVTNPPKINPQLPSKTLSIQSTTSDVVRPKKSNGIGCRINNAEVFNFGRKKFDSVIRFFACKSSKSLQYTKTPRRVSIRHQLDVEINDACLAYITSLATINSDISEFLNDSVIVTTKILHHTPWSLEALKLTRMACKSEDNTIKCISYGLNVFMNTLTFNYKKEPPDKVISFSFILSIISSFLAVKHRLLCYESVQLDNIIYNSDFYVKILFDGIRSIIGFHHPTTEIQCHHVFLCVEMMKCLYLIFKTNHEILLECCYTFHIVDILLVALKETEAQPEILGTSAEGIAIVLGYEDTRNEFIAYVSKETSYFVPLLSYFKMKWEQYHNSLAEIAKLFNLFLILSNEGDPIAKDINHQLEINGRDECLLYGVEIGGEIGLECIKCLSLCKTYTIDTIISLRNVMGMKTFFDDASLEMIGYIIKILTKVVSGCDVELPEGEIAEILEAILLILTTSLLLEEKLCVKNAMFARSCAAQFIVTLGYTKTGKELLRESCAKICHVLFLEQENCPFNHIDLPVERICDGVSTPLMVLDMVTFVGDTPREVIKPNVKQAFRVVSALADYCQHLSGNGPSHENKLSEPESLKNILKNCIDCEQDFFQPINELEPIYTGSSSVSDKDKREMPTSNAEGLTSNASEFVEYDLLEKLLDYLSKGRDLKNYGVTDKSSSEYFVGLLKGDKITFEREEKPKLPLLGDWFVKNARGDICTGKDLDKAVTENDTSMLTLCKISYASACGITLANYQKESELTEDGGNNTNKILPTNLVWSNCYLKKLNPCFIAAAYLRCLYGLLHSNAANNKYVCDKFKQPAFVRKIIIIITNIPLLECNLYSKFFAVTQKALSFEPLQHVESMDMAVVYDIVSGTCNKAISTILPYLSAGPNVLFDLKMSNLLVFVEQLMKLLYLLVTQTPYIKFSDKFTVQQWCVEKCLTRFITTQTLEFIHLILNQILTLETGSFRGTFVAHYYDAVTSKSIEGFCLKILQGIMCTCPSTRRFEALYHILEAKESGSIVYRQTLIDELVISSYYERYRIAYQGYIAEVEHVPEAVTTVSKVICKIHSDKIPFTERLLLLSTHNIHILELPKPQHFDDLDHVKLDIKHALKGKYILKKLSEIIIYESLTENVSIQSTQSTSTYDNENDALNLTCKIVPTSLCYMRLKVDCDVVELIFTKSADYHNLLAKLSHVKPTITKLPEALLKSINITTLQCDKFDKVLSLGWEQLSVYSFDWQKGEESAPETHEFGMLEKVTFGENLTVLVKFKDSKEKSLTFLSDSSLQSFKRALAQALYNLENSGKWKRTIDFH